MELREPIEVLLSDSKALTEKSSFPDPHCIRLYDETLRDGEQMPGLCYTPGQKLEIAKALADLGVHIISVGFPAASIGDRLALQLIMRAKRRGELGSVEIVVMCRSNHGDIDATVETLRELDIQPREVTFFVFTSGSDLHLKYKIGKTLLQFEGRDEREWLDLPLEFYRNANIRLQCDAIAYACSRGAESVEFAAEDASRANVEYMGKYYNSGIQAGGTRATWPDTVSTLTPETTRWHCSNIVQMLPPGIPLGIHLHNDYGLATINAITATACGFTVVAVTANGYGERAGNVKLHEYVVALRQLYGIEIPGFKYNKLRDFARFMERMSGVPMQPHEPIVGTRVFTHETGIHCHAMLVHRRMYEAIPSDLVGAETTFLYGKHSGVAAVENVLTRERERLANLGIETSRAFAERVTEEVKRIREERAASSNFEEIMIAHDELMRGHALSEHDIIDVALAIGKSQSAIA